MLVRELMSTRPATVSEDATLADAVALMQKNNCGFIPVLRDDGTIAGVLTDRDAIFAVHDAGTTTAEVSVRAAMTRDVATCNDVDDLAEVHYLMRRNLVRRAPVLGPDRKLVGVISIADLAHQAMATHNSRERDWVGETLGEISRPTPWMPPHEVSPS